MYLLMVIVMALFAVYPILFIPLLAFIAYCFIAGYYEAKKSLEDK